MFQRAKRKSKAKVGVGQLVLKIVFPEETGEAKDRVEETEDNGPAASSAHVPSRGETASIANPSPTREPPATPEPQTRPPATPGGTKGTRKRKWYSLIDKVYALSNLIQAWRVVAANRGAPGIDGMTIDAFRKNDLERLEQLSQDLRNKTYRPQPVRRVYIPKSGGGQRPLGIPTVRDRIVQQALLQILSPIFEEQFSQRSHGFRPQRGTATALQVVDRAVRHGYQWVVDADIRSFFDNVDQDKLLQAVNEEVSDGSVLRLIRAILRAGVIQPGVNAQEASRLEATEKGTPQGGPLSPLLANIYLHAFDKKMEQAGYGLVRYADDFVIFARSREEAEAALRLIREILEGEWKLQIHPEKTRIVSVDEGFEFLGYHYYRDQEHGVLRKRMRQKSIKNFRESIRKRTPRLRNQRKPKEKHISLQRLAENQRLRAMLKGVNEFLRGWHWYFKGVWTNQPAERRHPTPFDSLDGFVRRRVRAALVGRTGNGWWNRRITNRMLADLGLYSLDELQRRYLAGELYFPCPEGLT
jgi:group II intron reverse transcriptase/maturase